MNNKLTNATSCVQAFWYGIVSGWRQPYDLSTSRSVDHLPGDLQKIQEVNDRGLTWGQLLRGGRNSQPVREGTPLFSTKNLDFKITEREHMQP